MTEQNKQENVIKGLECCLSASLGEPICPTCTYRFDKNGIETGDCEANLLKDAIALLKDSGQDEGWLCEKRTSGRQTTDLLCACGNKVCFTTLLFKDGFTANELYCPNCGLSMRSPHHDKNGVWLRKHWEEVVLKAQEPRVVKMSELTAGEPMLVWLEDIDKDETVAGMIFDYVPGRLGFKLTDLASMDRIYPLIDEYLTRWRCWTSRPDKATREATPWE